MNIERLLQTGIACSLVLFPINGNAWDDSPECFKRFERNFFRERDLDEAFGLHQVTVPQSNWNAIYRALQRQMQQVPEVVKRQAQKMDKNPLDHPFQPEQAQKILFDTLYAVFSQVMHDYGVTDQYSIRDMFNYLMQKQQLEIDACFAPKSR